MNYRVYFCEMLATWEIEIKNFEMQGMAWMSRDKHDNTQNLVESDGARKFTSQPEKPDSPLGPAWDVGHTQKHGSNAT